MIEKLKVPQEVVRAIKIKRAHRINGGRNEMVKPRRIVCKFTFLGIGKLCVDKVKLEKFYLSKQFPVDIMAKRMIHKRETSQRCIGRTEWTYVLYLELRWAKCKKKRRLNSVSLLSSYDIIILTET